MAGSSNIGQEELIQALFKAKEECRRTTMNAPAPTGDDGEPLEVYCPAEWDNILCWPQSPPGPVSIGCPQYVADFNHDAVAQRHCTETGQWHFSQEMNKTWTYYAACHSMIPSEDELLNNLKHGTPNMKRLVQLYTVGYACTLVALTFATFILAYFRKLHCTRNYIHLHLFASFMLRAIIIFIKDRVLFVGSGILDLSASQQDQIVDELMLQVQDSHTRSYLVGCKFVMTLFHYFVATNYYWILVEALHLHSLIFLAVFSGKKYFWKFILIGWGAPVLFVVPWAIVRATIADTQCWDVAILHYKWIYNGPIVIANVINFILFLNIIRVLWYKMRENSVISGTDNRKQYRKLAKSTLVLIFMFGIHAIIFIGMPDSVQSGMLWNIRMYFDLFFNSFQGFFVAIIYCFCNGEVQQEFKNAWQRFQNEVEVQRGTGRDRIRSSVTGLSSFISSDRWQQARPSVAGQGGRRGSNSLKSPNLTINQDCNSTSPSADFRVPLLEQNGHQNSVTADDYLLSLGEDAQLVANAKKAATVQETSLLQTATSPGQDYEETAFEKALEEESHDANRDRCADSSTGGSESSSAAESDGQKLFIRTPSFDSGISVRTGNRPPPS